MKNLLSIMTAILLISLNITGCTKKANNNAMPQAISPRDSLKPESIQNSQQEVPASQIEGLRNVVQDKSGKIVLYWYDPMKSDKHFTKPGVSPFMDMQLIPEYAKSANKGGQP